MMAITSEWDRILDYCRVHAEGASQDGILQALYETCLDFFRFTSAWKSTAEFTTIVGEQVYEILLEAPGSPIRLVGVIDLNGCAWRAVMPFGKVLIPSIPPSIVSTQGQAGTIQLLQSPTSAQTLIAQFIMNVTLPTDGNNIPQIPDWALPMFSQEFIDGTLWKLHATPKKTYTDLTAAQMHRKEFYDGMCAARVAAQRNNTYDTQTFMFPQRWATGGQRGGVSVGNEWRF